jgi:hypothetical protein
MPRIQDVKILDLEEVVYYDRKDQEQKHPLSGVLVTMKFQGEKQSFNATLKEEHLKAGIHRQLDDMRGLGKFATLNLGAMPGERGITWFFPGETRGGVNPVLQTVQKPALVGSDPEQKPEPEKSARPLFGKTGT